MPTYDIDVVYKGNAASLVSASNTVEAELRQVKSAASDAATGSTSAFSGMASGIQGAFTAASGFIIAQIAQVGVQGVLELRALGDQVNDTRALFEGLGGSAEELTRLGRAARGASSELELMTAAVDLRKLGLGETTEELERWIGLIDRLKPDTQSLADAAGQIAESLTKGRVGGLTAFGLDPDAIKASADAMLAAGSAATEQQATQLATMEAMQTQVDRLGPALEGQVGDVDRLEAEFQTIREHIASMVDNITGPFITGLYNGILLLQQLDQIVQGVLRNAGVLQGGTRGDVLRSQTMEEAMNEAESILALSASDSNPVNFEDIKAARDAAAAEWRAAQANADALGDAAYAMRNAPPVPTPPPDYYLGGMGLLQRNSTLASQALQSTMPGAPLTFNEQSILTGIGGSGNVQMPRFITPMEAETFALLAAKAEKLAADMKEAGVTDEQLQAAQDYAGWIGQVADAAGKAAAAFENMSLSTALGTDSPDQLLAQGTDALKQSLTDAGFSTEEIDNVVDQLDLISGRQTELSQDFEATMSLWPQIIERYGEDGVRAFAAFMENLRRVQAGQMPRPEDLLNLGGFQVTGGGGPGVTLQPGDTPSGLARQYGYGNNWQQFLRDVGKDPNQYTFRVGEQLNIGGPTSISPFPEFGSMLNQRTSDTLAGGDAQDPFQTMLSSADEMLTRTTAIGDNITAWGTKTDEANAKAMAYGTSLEAPAGKIRDMRDDMSYLTAKPQRVTMEIIPILNDSQASNLARALLPSLRPVMDQMITDRMAGFKR